MTFNTEKNKLQKLWNESQNNTNIIITQKDNNIFIIDNVNELNRQNSIFPILTNFSSDFLIPTTLLTPGDVAIVGNFSEFRLIFNNVDASFIPYIHCEIVYRVGTSGVIPTATNFSPPPDEIPFDEQLAQSFILTKLETNEIFQINETNVEYISFMRMDSIFENLPEVEYKFICYISNPHYYQSN